jgi:CheY-like chemotaxis protein
MLAPCILIIDDDLAIREALSEVIESRGFSVISAANGKEALSLLRSVALPAAIMLDLMMPVMDGYTFLEEQRKDPHLASIPVAILTAGTAVDHSRIAPPPPPIVRKPIKLPQLFDVIHELTA